MDLGGAHALVTGGGRGIGAAISAALHAAGARVSIIGRDASRLAQHVADGHADAWATADVTDAAALQAALATLTQAGGAPSILVNNAGAAHSAPFARTSADDFRRMLEINLISAVSASQLVLPAMVEAGYGRIVNVASTAALKGYPYVSAYVAAKHALLGFTRALALETATSGVTVNAVCPGFTDTDLIGDSIARIVSRSGRTAEAARAEFTRANPQGRLIAPEEVALAVLHLCAPGLASVTGTSLIISGGEVQ